LEDGVAGENRNIDALLLTHTHYDHTGSCSYLQNRFQFDIYTSTVGANLLKKRKVVDFINHLNREYDRQTGVKTDITLGSLRKLKALSEGDILPVDSNHHLKVLETPGHTRCSLSFLLLPDRILFPGDSVGVAEKDGTVKPLFLSSYLSYIESLRKLMKLRAEMICFSHNRFIRGRDRIARFLERSLQSAVDFKETILRHQSSSGEIDAEDLAAKVLDAHFPHPTVMGPREALLINVMAMIKAVVREFPLPQS
jgi:glyoxylase-like metal-dependent hydrolase (beta-lactamase superfamily II)